MMMMVVMTAVVPMTFAMPVLFVPIAVAVTPMMMVATGKF